MPAAACTTPTTIRAHAFHLQYACRRSVAAGVGGAQPESLQSGQPLSSPSINSPQQAAHSRRNRGPCPPTPPWGARQRGLP
jgi:hypothetical protein